MRILPDAMVLAAGLTSRREPSSFSRRLLEAVADGVVDLVLTETLLDEARAVIVDPEFVGHQLADVADELLTALRIVAVVLIDDRDAPAPARCADPDDDYLVDAALATGAMLVSRDDRAGFSSIPDLDSGRPGTALRRAGLLS